MEGLVFEGWVDDSSEDLTECLRLLREQVREMEYLRREVAALQIQIEQQLHCDRTGACVVGAGADTYDQRAALRAVWQQVSAKSRPRSASQRWFSW